MSGGVLEGASPSIEWGGFGACLPLIEWGRFAMVSQWRSGAPQAQGLGLASR
jgi:hypothetical protein